MRNRIKSLVLILSTAALVTMGCASKSELPYVEPVQQISYNTWDYDVPLKFTKEWFLQKDDKSNYTGENNWSFGWYVLLPGDDECYRVVNEADADTVYIQNETIWTKGQFGDDRGQLELDDLGEGDSEQDRNDRDVDQER